MLYASCLHCFVFVFIQAHTCYPCISDGPDQQWLGYNSQNTTLRYTTLHSLSPFILQQWRLPALLGDGLHTVASFLDFLVRADDRSQSDLWCGPVASPVQTQKLAFAAVQYKFCSNIFVQMVYFYKQYTGPHSY